MIQAFVLIFVLQSGHGLTTGVVHFTDKRACVAAANEVRRQADVRSTIIVLTCTPQVLQ